jgi:hypothetical protein
MRTRKSSKAREDPSKFLPLREAILFEVGEWVWIGYHTL